MSAVALIGLSTFVATLLGPIMAVLLTRWIDQRRSLFERRLSIFRTLMGSRNFPISREFVGALNLIDVEFHECSTVIRAWRAYLANVSGPQASDPVDAHRIADQRRDLRTDILVEIAKVVRLPIPELDIFRGGYSPQGWANIENEQNLVRGLLAEIARGSRGFPIVVRPSTDPPSTAP